MPELHLTSLYIAAAAWIVQQGFTEHVDRAQLLRSTSIAILIGVASLFAPTRSGWMVVLLCGAYLAGVLGLSAILSNRFGGGQSTFAGSLLVLFGFLFLAMLAMALPLVLIAWTARH